MSQQFTYETDPFRALAAYGGTFELFGERGGRRKPLHPVNPRGTKRGVIGKKHGKFIPRTAQPAVPIGPMN